MKRFLLAAAGLLLLAPSAPAAVTSPTSAVMLGGGSTRTLTMCGAERQALAARTRSRVVLSVAAPRAVWAVPIARCSRDGRWTPVRSARLRPHADGALVRTRLPHLAPGRYRVGGGGLPAAYLRVSARRAAASQAPLLDLEAVRSPMAAFCDGPDGDGPHQSDATALPLDPRRLVNANLGRTDIHTYFNASWIEVHAAEGFRPHPIRYPKTCGGFRRWAQEGESFLHNRPFFQLIASANAYDNLWRTWGLKAKPKDFDEQVIQRYGFSAAPFKNPYPKPGEARGGSGGTGQLPLGLVQGRDKASSYNGKITISCSACHDSILGTKADGLGLFHGRGNDGIDATLFAIEMGRAAFMIGEYPEPGAVAAGLIPFPYSAGRGLTNAFGLLDFLAAGFDMETLDASPGVEFFPTHGAAGQVQTPNWWNRSHRTRMFFNGELSGDNARVSMALAVAQTERTGAEIKAMEPSFERLHVFLESLSPPKYPKPIDLELAETGAVLFHEKDLWAEPANRGRPRVPGNGSCSSCHGVYSPRYAEDPKFLPDPRLLGIEASITPLEVIGTDPARTRLVNEQFKRAWNTSWWGYDELNPQWTPDGQGRKGTTFQRALYDYGVTENRLEGPNRWSNDPIGYEAQPLYGVWASAPYFHNGSVPTVRGVLQPGRRPKLWRRPSTRAGEGGIAQGLDSSFAGYDFANLGYRYEDVQCSDGFAERGVLVPCHPHGSPLSVVQSELSKLGAEHVFLFNQDAPPFTESDRQRRMIMNTHEYSLGNQGHEFTSVLSDPEVDALLEYLKTL